MLSEDKETSTSPRTLHPVTLVGRMYPRRGSARGRPRRWTRGVRVQGWVSVCIGNLFVLVSVFGLGFNR